MKQLKKILFPTDFSPMAKGAFVYALGLAKAFNAKIKVVNIYHADFGVPVPENMAYEMLEARKGEAERNMSLFIKQEPGSPYADVPLETVVEPGFAADVIADYSTSVAAEIDLIVMGTKGEHNAMEKLLGSVTSAVIANAHCPVLAVPENAKFGAVKEIAYATDLKSDTKESLREVADIAALFGAALHCVRVDTHAKNLSAELQQFSALAGQLNLDAKIAEVSGDTIANGLEQYMRENGIELLLMYRPERSFFERIFHNSVTKQVAMHSTVPLLVFKKH